LKLHENLSKSAQIKRAKGLAKSVQINFENSTKDFYNPKNRVVLKTLEFTVENREFYSSFGEEDPNKKKQKLQLPYSSENKHPSKISTPRFI
jgi:hypothetical protein